MTVIDMHTEIFNDRNSTTAKENKLFMVSFSAEYSTSPPANTTKMALLNKAKQSVSVELKRASHTHTAVGGGIHGPPLGDHAGFDQCLRSGVHGSQRHSLRQEIHQLGGATVVGDENLSSPTHLSNCYELAGSGKSCFLSGC